MNPNWWSSGMHMRYTPVSGLLHLLHVPLWKECSRSSMCFPVLRSLLTGHFLSEIFPTTFMRIATTHQRPLSPSSLYFPVAFISPDTCFAYNLFIIYLLPRRTDYFHSCSLVYLQSMEECLTHYRPSNVSMNIIKMPYLSFCYSTLLGLKATLFS